MEALKGINIMMEYLKRKFAKLKTTDFDKVSYPRYYEENGKLIKELASGEKWEFILDSNHKEVLIERLK
jgi:hypothetical protein